MRWEWDVSGIDGWKSDDFPRGAVIPEAGNSAQYSVGGWRAERPIIDHETCTDCLLCWISCPDVAIRANEGELEDDTFDLDACKGCGICSNVCPVDAIVMENEQVCLLREAE